MARSCGIRIGPRRFELVVLEGSPKRHKISAYYSGEFSPADAAAFAEGDVTGVGAQLKEAAKSHRIPTENVAVVMATDHAAFRHVTLPFSDRAKIEQVLRFEVESELPQFDIDQVVIDYHVQHENDSGAELLVTAIPKDDVSRVIKACEKGGFEALEVEMEASAMVNAAFAADICHIDDAQLLVHIGEHSTTVVVVAGAEVREFRVIHIGAMTHLAKELGAPDGDDLDGGEDDEAFGSIDPIESSRKVEQAIKRIRRELGRTISAARTPQEIEAIYVCGMELPGLIGSDVLGVPIYVLDCFDADSGQPADGFGQLVAAYGGAFRQLGGGSLKPSLRRDELRFTGTWERLEFPVAFAALMLATFLGMVTILQMRKIDAMSYGGVLNMLRNSNEWIVGNPKKPTSPPIMNPVPKAIADRALPYFEATTGVLPEGVNEPLDELYALDELLGKMILDLGKQVGDIQDIPLPPSAFAATTLVLGVLNGNEAWRPSLRSIKSAYEKQRSDEPEHVLVTLQATFFAEDAYTATNHLAEFDAALRATPWCLGVTDVTTEPIDGDGGLHFNGKKIKVDPSKYFQARAQAAN